MHTENSGDQPIRWVRVDLLGLFTVRAVVVTNRGDCCGERLKDFKVYVMQTLDDPSEMTHDISDLCFHRIGEVDLGATERLPCYQPITGQYVSLVMNSTENQLHICELQVMGTKASVTSVEPTTAETTESPVPYVKPTTAATTESPVTSVEPTTAETTESPVPYVKPTTAATTESPVTAVEPTTAVTTESPVTNVALNKPAVQSTYHKRFGNPENVVDGNLETDLKNCTQTAKQDNSTIRWWRVDLMDLFTVHAVTITNRGDCCGFRLKNFKVYVMQRLDDPTEMTHDDSHLCHRHKGAVKLGATVSLSCSKPITGQYVSLVMPSNAPLHFCELQVMGTQAFVNNLALNKPAVQSTYHKRFGKPQQVVDGNRETDIEYCTQTDNNDKKPIRWWRVDLMDLFNVQAVTITNRGDCCGTRLKDFKVYVMQTLDDPTEMTHDISDLCIQYNGSLTQGATQRLPCSRPITGRYVSLVLPSTKPLNFCELHVAGTQASERKRQAVPALEASVPVVSHVGTPKLAATALPPLEFTVPPSVMEGSDSLVNSVLVTREGKLLFGDKHQHMVMMSSLQTPAVVEDTYSLSYPWAMLQLHNGSIAVTMEDQYTITLLNIVGDSLQFVSLIHTVDNYGGIAQGPDNTLIVSKWRDDSFARIDIINMDGDLQRTLLQNESFLINPFCLKRFGEDVYVSDWTSNAVFRVNVHTGGANFMMGDLDLHDLSFKKPRQLDLDSEGNLYVATGGDVCDRGDCIIQVKQAGPWQQMQTYTSQNVGKYPFGLGLSDHQIVISWTSKTVNGWKSELTSYPLAASSDTVPTTTPSPSVDSCDAVTNVALNKPAEQSTYHPVYGHPEKAVDGNMITAIAQCTHTADVDNNATRWWRVDLQGVYRVYGVAITDRGDCCGEHLSNFAVVVHKTVTNPGEQEPSRESPCLVHTGALEQGATQRLRCYKPVIGRYVSLVLLTDSVPLQFCEMQVLAKPVTEKDVAGVTCYCSCASDPDRQQCDCED